MPYIHPIICPGCLICARELHDSERFARRALESLQGEARGARQAVVDSKPTLIHAENTVLSRGGDAPVRDSDDHVAHIRGHAGVDGPAAETHVLEHIAALRKIDDALAPFLKES